MYFAKRTSLNVRLNAASEETVFISSGNPFHNFGPVATMLFLLCDVLKENK